MGEGLLAEFDDPSALVRALETLRELGHTELDAYSPHPVDGVDRALGLRRSTVARSTLVGGILGALTGYIGQWWISAVDFPLNIGGRPPHSPPAFIPVTYELTILFASFATVIALFVKARLGSLWASEDEVTGFESVSVDRFWLSVRVEVGEPSDSVERHLIDSGARQVIPFGREQ